MELIDKSALVAEIEKKIDKYNKLHSFNYGAVKDLESLLNFLDTLDVKEVDLEKELDRYTNSAEYVYNETRDSYFLVAKHFFELGIRSKATKVSEFLKKHFEETPQEELDKEWKEIEPLNDIGPDVLEYTDKKEK